MNYRADMDGLRTVAVIPVVLFHAGLGLQGGYVGVDVFFVISGYLITTLLLKDLAEDRFSILTFYERRARRIFPALFVMILVTTVLAAILMIPVDLDLYGKSAIAATGFLANIWFYTQEGYFTEAAELKPLLHTWSLGIEEQYYVVFPVLLCLASRRLRPGGIFLLLAVCLGLSLLISAFAVARAPSAAFYLPHYRIWELLLGSLLAIAMTQGWLEGVSRHRRVVAGLSVLGLAAILVPIFAYGPETPFPGLAALPPCLGTAVLIATGGSVATPVSRLLATAPMVFVGQLSYSLYLWHWPIIAFTSYSFGDLGPLEGASCAALAFGLAYLSWRHVERPFRERTRFSRPAIFGASAVAMMAIFGLGAMLAKTNGLPGRMPEGFPLEISRDQFLHDRRDCHFVDAARGRAGDVCLRGDTTAAPSFVLVGDSHADAFSPALFAAADSLGLSGYQYTGAGFRPLPGVSRRGATEHEAVAALIGFLRDNPGIRTVFYTGYWEHQMTGYSYRHHGDVWTDAGYDGSGSRYNRTATLGGLNRLADALPDRHIVLLDTVPTGDALHLPTQLRFMRFGLEDHPGLPRAEADRQRQTYEPDFRDLARRRSNVSYRPVFESLCPAEYCPLFDGGMLLFRDGDHLSLEGALRLVPAARALLSDDLIL